MRSQPFCLIRRTIEFQKQENGLQKKRHLTENGTESSVKKTKKIKGDSSSEVSCFVADVSKSRIHSSVATLPVQEFPQMGKPLSNVSKTLNTSVKRSQRHKEPTPENEVLTNEETVSKSHGDALDINEGSPFLPKPRDMIVSKREWSNASFSGSVKDIKRVVTRKIPRPSSNLDITTAEIRNKEEPFRK
ncbi:hypothetical protein TNCV_775201 [Trichonephila clavipes]|nr:hypothetical protein TNCV_775201 [Trichonephila clavipes]